MSRPAIGQPSMPDRQNTEDSLAHSLALHSSGAILVHGGLRRTTSRASLLFLDGPGIDRSASARIPVDTVFDGSLMDRSSTNGERLFGVAFPLSKWHALIPSSFPLVDFLCPSPIEISSSLLVHVSYPSSSPIRVPLMSSSCIDLLSSSPWLDNVPYIWTTANNGLLSPPCPFVIVERLSCRLRRLGGSKRIVMRCQKGGPPG
jgi:hypothetical protein